MKQNNFCLYMDLQIVSINQHKKKVSEISGKDYEEHVVYDWIVRNAKKFNEEYGWLLDE